MIIKEQEYNDLVNAKRLLQEEYENESKRLIEKINVLEQDLNKEKDRVYYTKGYNKT